MALEEEEERYFNQYCKQLKKKPSQFHLNVIQIFSISRASLLRKWREPFRTIFPTCAALIIGLLISFIWFQLPNSPSSAKATYRVITLEALYYTVGSNLTLYTIFRRDRAVRLGKGQFNAVAVWFGRVLGELPLRIIHIFLISFLVYPISSLRPGVRYFMLTQMAYILQSWGNVPFGMIASAATGNSAIAVWIACGINSFNYLFSGVPYSSNRVSWILLWLRYLSVSFYVTQIEVWAQFKGRIYPDSDITGDDILEQTGWLNTPLAVSICCLLVLIVLLNALGVLLLWLTTRRKSREC